MTREEIIENLWGEIVRRNIDLSKSNITEIVDFVIKNYKPELPEGLDEAAEEFAHLFDQGTCNGIAQECFKAGAEWIAGQGVRASASVGYYNQCGLSILTEPSIKKLGFKEGDDLEITLRKK